VFKLKYLIQELAMTSDCSPDGFSQLGAFKLRLSSRGAVILNKVPGSEFDSKNMEPKGIGECVETESNRYRALGNPNPEQSS
jgi:hypothetical protein